MFVLALPLSAGAEAITLLAFVGGLSAATAMVIVEFRGAGDHGLQRPGAAAAAAPARLRADRASSRTWRGCCWPSAASPSSPSCCWAICSIGCWAQTHGLASIGLVSFAAIAQFAPAFFGGLIWRNATARGAIAGIVAGFAVWAYTLLLPWIIEAGWLPRSVMTEGPFGLSFLAPQALFYLQTRPADARRAVEHGRQRLGVRGRLAAEGARAGRAPAGARVRAQRPAARRRWRRRSGMWRTSDHGRRPAAHRGALSRRRAGASGRSRSTPRAAARRSRPNAEADIHLVRFTEHLLASAIGAASSRLVLSLLLRRGDAGSQSALRLLDDASEALQYNRDLLQSALDQVRHGLSVFDRDMQLICWNRQFRELLEPARRSSAASARRSTGSCAPAPSAATSARGDVDKLGRRPADEAGRDARDVPGALRRRQAHPRDPHEPHAAGRHRHHLFRHHRARRGGRGAGARQRDAGAARAGSAPPS